MARIPFLASMSDAGKNMFKAVNNGYNFNPVGGFNMKSVGGALTSTIGMAGLGAATGAAISTQTDGQDIAPMAAAGAVAGAAALPAVGLGIRGVGAAGNAALNGVVAAAPYVGSAAVKAGSALGAGALWSGSRLMNATIGIGSSLVNWDMATETLGPVHRETLLGKATKTGGVKLTNPISGFKAGWNQGESALGKVGRGVRGGLINGQTVFWGGAAIKGVKDAFQEVNKIRMGTNDGQITRAAPRVPSYLDNAGASGDLVFALNANRRG